MKDIDLTTFNGDNGLFSIILRSLNFQEKTMLVKINNGDRIAQVVIGRHEQADWIEVSELVETERGGGGFGSTGTA